MRRADFLKLLGLAGASYASPAFAQGEIPIQPGECEVNPAFINSGPGFGNRVALTFDDGPSPGVTDRVLTELSQARPACHFFPHWRQGRCLPATRPTNRGGGPRCGQPHLHSPSPSRPVR